MAMARDDFKIIIYSAVLLEKVKFHFSNTQIRKDWLRIWWSHFRSQFNRLLNLS